jgi:hypothetical protein
MTALVLWAFRLIVLFVIVRTVLSLVSKKPFFSRRGRKTAARFDAKGKPVEDAEFKEL